MIKNKITAVLGPTNTGKTFLAIETMLSFDSGMIGFPLRLLAREVYDKIITKIDPSKVALITGEEKIIPINAKYFLCTVECFYSSLMDLRSFSDTNFRNVFIRSTISLLRELFCS